MSVRYQHKFKVKNGKIIFDNTKMMELQKQQFEGKEGYVTFHEVYEDPTQKQYAFYFFGIIQKECIESSNEFAGWEKDEVHNYFMKRLWTEKFNVKGHTIVWQLDFKDFNKERMKQHISKVIDLLATEHNIRVKTKEEYNIKGYRYEKRN
jgi:hypothetical protein